MTKLEKSLKRELRVGKQAYVLTIEPEGFKLTKKGKRKGVEIAWKGKGLEEVGFDAKSGKVYVEVDPRYFRPTEVDLLLGNPAKAHRELGWKHETGFDALVEEMMTEDITVMGREWRRNAE